MFSSKLVWLLAILLVSPSALASETSPVAQFLIDRAHYWVKLGNRDLELITWKEVLQVEPDNSEALSRIAQDEVVKPKMSSNKADVAVKPITVPHAVSKVEPAHDVVDVLAQEIGHDAKSADPAGLRLSETIGAPAKPVVATLRAPLPVEPAASPVSTVVSAPAKFVAVSVSTSLHVEPTTSPVPAESVTGREITEIKTAQPVPKKTTSINAKNISDGKAVTVEYWPVLTAGRGREQANVAESGVATQAGVSLPSVKTPARKAIPVVDSTLNAVNQTTLKKMRVSDATGQASHRVDAQVAVVVKPDLVAEDKSQNKSNAIEKKSMGVPSASASVNNQEEENNSAKKAKPVSTSQDSVVLSGAVRGADKKLQQDLLARTKGVQGVRLRESLDNEPSVNKVVKAKVAMTMPVIPYPKMHPKLSTRVLTQAKAKPTARELALKAKYWQAHGRADLAEQIRRKIQLLAPEQVINRPFVAQRVVPQNPVSAKQNASVSALEDSLLKNPNALKVKLDLAEIYRSIGGTPRARVLIDSLLVDSPDLPEARYASAQLYADQHLWMETLHELEKISPVSRTSNMAKLQKSAWAHVQLDRADALARQGRNAEADRVLRQVAAKLVIHDVMMPVFEPPPLWIAPKNIKRVSAGKKLKNPSFNHSKHTVKHSVSAQKM